MGGKQCRASPQKEASLVNRPYAPPVCAPVCCSVLQCVAVCCSLLQCFAVCCSVFSMLQCVQCFAVCCSVLQCVAVCCSTLQCVAASHNHIQIDVCFQKVCDMCCMFVFESERAKESFLRIYSQMHFFAKKCEPPSLCMAF